MPVIGFFGALMLIGVPIVFVLTAVTIALILYSGEEVLFLSFHQQMFGGMEKYGLLALPLFILVGELMGAGGIARRLVAMADAIVGNIRGGLAYANLLANALMAAILGSAVAQISVMNRVMTPEMLRAGYTRRFAVSLSTAGGLLAPIIPPSMMLVVFGVLAQISIGELFMAGIVPGLLLGTGFFVIIALLGRFHPYPKPQALDPAEKTGALREGLPAILVPLAIIASIATGIATPTESAALAGLVAILIGKYIYRELEWADLWPSFTRSAINAGLILILIGAAQIFGFVITFEQIPAVIAAWISAIADSPLTFLLLLNVLLLIVGMFIDGIAALIIVVPVLLPIAMQTYGINPFHFGVIVCLNLALGLVTPPVGAGLFVAAATSGEKPEKVAVGVLPFIAVAIGVLVLLSLVPALITLLL